MSTSSEKPTKRAKVQTPPRVAAPVLPYEPRDPKRYRPGIALVGCGGITKWHLRAYQEANYKIVALCDMVKARAEERRDVFFPDAVATDSVDEVLSRDDV